MTAAGVLLAAAAGLGLTAPTSASASCVGPQLHVSGAAVATPSSSPSEGAPVTLTSGAAVTVTGEYFFSGCADAVGSGGPGCSSTTSDPQHPLRAVALTLRQGSRSWPLGSADAADTGTYAIRWAATVPADAAAGPATLATGSATAGLGAATLAVVIAR